MAASVTPEFDIRRALLDHVSRWFEIDEDTTLSATCYELTPLAGFKFRNAEIGSLALWREGISLFARSNLDLRATHQDHVENSHLMRNYLVSFIERDITEKTVLGWVESGSREQATHGFLAKAFTTALEDFQTAAYAAGVDMNVVAGELIME